MELIRVENLNKTYQNPDSDVQTIALKDINFNLSEGEFLSIMGPSGSGKSTLMHIMGLLDQPSSGKIMLKEKDVSQLTDDQAAILRNKEIGFIFQSFNLLPRISVFENVLLPLSYIGLNRKEEEEMAKSIISSVGMDHRINFMPNQLSGGEQQRVAIARALVNNPSIVFADEPTGNLDSHSGRQVMKVLQDLNSQGKTIVLVTHEQATAQHAARILKLKDGQLISDEKVVDRKFAKDNRELAK